MYPFRGNPHLGGSCVKGTRRMPTKRSKMAHIVSLLELKHVPAMVDSECKTP